MDDVSSCLPRANSSWGHICLEHVAGSSDPVPWCRQPCGVGSVSGKITNIKILLVFACFWLLLMFLTVATSFPELFLPISTNSRPDRPNFHSRRHFFAVSVRHRDVWSWRGKSRRLAKDLWATYIGNSNRDNIKNSSNICFCYFEIIACGFKFTII